MTASVADSSSTTPVRADTGKSSYASSIKEANSVSEDGMQMGPMGETTDEAKAESESLKEHHDRGYNWLVAAIIIVADMVGGGLVAMPAGFTDTGLVLGCIFMIIIAIFFTSTAHLLAQTWGMMRDRWPVYKTHCRRPYPEIGMRSFGPKMRVFTALCVYITLFGTTTVYVILSSTIFHNFLAFLGVKLHFCLLLVILTVIIWPITFLKSPADFWFVVAFALFCTIFAVILILIGVSLDYDCKSHAAYQPPKFNAIYSLGTFIFAYSGHHVFPTVQHDMYEPKEFPKSVLLGYFMTCCLYIPVSVYSYVVYGQSMLNSVINSLQTNWIRYASDLAIAFHCVLTIILTINPVNQQLEDIFRCPQKMCWQRIAIRTGLLVIILFVALSIPSFGSIMDFFGSTTIPFTCIILPTLFGLWLKAQRYNEKTKEWEVPTLKELVITGIIIAMAPFRFGQVKLPSKAAHRHHPMQLNCWISSFGAVNVSLKLLACMPRQQMLGPISLPEYDKAVPKGLKKHLAAISISKNMMITIIGGVISAVMAVEAMVTIRFVPPCYVQPFMKDLTSAQDATHLVNCCGEYMNITKEDIKLCFVKEAS